MLCYVMKTRIRLIEYTQIRQRIQFELAFYTDHLPPGEALASQRGTVA